MAVDTNINLDERDAEILRQRVAALDARPGPRVGDFVEFTDGVIRRISHIWPDRVQTSDTGSYYLGSGYISMSGSLHTPVPTDTLQQTERTRPGRVWLFHHDHATAHNSVEVTISFRVFTCVLPAPV